MRPLARLDSLGLVTPALVAVHGASLEEAELELIRRAGAGIVLCLAAGLARGDRLPPIEALAAARRAGVRLCLGSAGAAWDLWNDIKLLALHGHIGAEHPVLTAREVLEIAARGGAAVLGLDAEIGTLEPGQVGGFVLPRPWGTRHAAGARAPRASAARRRARSGERCLGRRSAVVERRPVHALGLAGTRRSLESLGGTREDGGHMSSPSSTNVDAAEVAKFDAMAQRWWDPNGPSKPLHDLNPLRLQYIDRAVSLAGKLLVDVGCGGGILSEAMARAGARVLGIDLSQACLDVAHLHALEARIEAAGGRLDYRALSAEALAQEQPAHFDAVTCMELLEHVPDPAAMLAALAALVRPGGEVIVSTLNRHPRAFAVAIVGAEYIARVLPRGTHDYLKFIRPSELARWGRAVGLDLVDVTGISYNPLTRSFRLSEDARVNYLARFRREA